MERRVDQGQTDLQKSDVSFTLLLCPALEWQMFKFDQSLVMFKFGVEMTDFFLQK